MDLINTTNTLNEFFQNKDFQVRIFGTNEQPLFCGKDIANILLYKDTKSAIQDHIDVEDKMTLKQACTNKGGEMYPPNSQPNMILINESGLYSLILRSNMEKAKEFKRWITKEVIPTIRKTGTFQLENQLKVISQEKELLQQNYDVLEKKQFIVDVKKPQKLTDRLIELKIITRLQKDKIYKEMLIEIKNRSCVYFHPDYKIFKNQILRLSKLISNGYKNLYLKHPDIIRKTRSNYYPLEFYMKIGDKLINIFYNSEIEKTIFDSIDFNWSAGENDNYCDDNSDNDELEDDDISNELL